LMSIPGIGEATAVAVLADTPPLTFQRCFAPLEPSSTPPELGHLEHAQAASLAGLAPVARESGTWRGKSFIRARPRAPASSALHASARRLGASTRR
jgi:transposase